MGDARTATNRTLSTSDGPQIVPGWGELLDRLEKKDRRIAELQEEVERLESELDGPDGNHVRRRPRGAESRASRARELVDALRNSSDDD